MCVVPESSGRFVKAGIMAKSTVKAEQRDALRVLIDYVAPDLATVVAQHERDCYLRKALDICLAMAGLSHGEFLELWVTGDLPYE
jgi:hypothetical protein